MAKDSQNNSTAAQLTVQTLLAPSSYPEPPAADERDLEPQRDNQACQRRVTRIERYAQRPNRKWICLAELLEQGGDKQFRPLVNSLLKGELNSNGRCRVLWLHPWSPPRRMTPEFLARILETFKATPWTVRDQYISHCWIPSHTAESWVKAPNIKLQRKSRRDRPRGQRQEVNKNDAQYIRLVAQFRAEGKSEREAVRMALENGQLDRTMVRAFSGGATPGAAGAGKYWSNPKSEANRIRKKFRDGQHR